MDIQIETGRFEDAAAVRRAVFMDEQGYENEFDSIDEAPSCIHVTLRVDGTPVGCARTFPEPLERADAPDLPKSRRSAWDEGLDEDDIYILGRVAVLDAWRHHGLASRVIAAAEQAARDAGAKLMKLHAQEYVTNLYASLGYIQIAPVDYEDEGQPHAWMAKPL